jgi:hypothetical protein
MNFFLVNLQVKLASTPNFPKSKLTAALELSKSLRLVVCPVRETNFCVDTLVDPK